MCGIAGFLTSGQSRIDFAPTLERMAAAIEHRGPDDSGVWHDQAHGIGLAHRRLSILDLSPLGHQPMVSKSGRFVMVFNGEIYNFSVLKAELQARGHQFKGGSDTEVLLAAFEEWGIERTFQNAIGMFAIAMWDRREHQLILSRDRFGEKPLYFGQCGSTLLFGSELKALRAHPHWIGAIDQSALASLLRYNYIPAPHSIYREIHKVRPAHWVTVKLDGARFEINERCYWDSKRIAEDSLSNPVRSAEEALAGAEARLAASVERQMVADVPLGAFLSGGVDSSLVVALMQRASRQPVKTFTIGFWERQFNEAEHAKKVARHLGTEHTELMVTPEDALRVIPQLPTIYDEPFADSSQIPTYLVSQLARSRVTVSLSGDAGDELFSGYDRYQQAWRRWSATSRVPLGIRRLAAASVRALPSAAYDVMFRGLGLINRDMRVKKDLHERMLARANSWTVASYDETYHRALMFWPDAEVATRGGRAPHSLAQRADSWPEGAGPIQRSMFVDLGLYLPDDILVKVDRAAMAVSLETRVPMLDPDLAQFAWRIPMEIHRRDGRGKWILREMLAKHVPRELFERPKMGFAIPLGSWLRGELKDWAAALLDPARLYSEGHFDAATISHRWQQHQSGSFDWSLRLWGVLMFQAWLEANAAMPNRADPIPKAASAS